MPSPVGASTDIGYLPLRKSAGICREEGFPKMRVFRKATSLRAAAICKGEFDLRLGREPGAQQINVSGTIAISKLT